MSQPNEFRRELGKDYWSLANGITAFAAVQSLAFTYAVAEHGPKIRTIPWEVTGGIVAGVVAFCIAVWFCHRAHTRALALEDPVLKSDLGWTRTGRILGIIGYGLFDVGILWASAAAQPAVAAGT